MSKKTPPTKTSDADQEEKLLLPFAYTQKILGKQIWPDLMLAFNHWLHVPQDKQQEVEEIIRMLHTCTLVIDDIQDSSVIRNGVPTAYIIYGIGRTINAATHAVFIAMERLLKLGITEATEIFNEQFLELYRGQGIEIYWRDTFICPSEDEYKQMVIQKTGGLFLLVIKLMQLFSDNKSDFSKLVNTFGVYFQIRDDFCSLRMQEYFDNKTYCEDLTEGKFSFPIIHAIKKQPEDSKILDILKQRTQSVEVKKYCVSLLESLGSFQYTKDTLESLDKELREEIERLGGNPRMISILDQLLNWREDTNDC